MTLMILADTSAWVDYDRASGSATDRRIAELVSEDGPLAVTQPVVVEIVAGARSDGDERRLRRLLQRFELLAFDSVIDFDGAVAIYRRCRQVGITPRGLVDCMIAAVALRHHADLLTTDRDLVRVAATMGIGLDAASAHL